MRVILFLLLCSLSAPAAAQTIAFSAQPTEECLAAASTPEARRACPGKAAAACVKAIRGAAEVERASCANAETEWWRARMDAAYARMMRQAELSDVEFAKELASGAPRMTDDLALMQAAWQDWSEKRCFFEAMRRRGKPDRSVAASLCTLQVTAEQSLLLEAASARR
ncbi:MAG: lysozyme inhibitor LprI family protein [Cereibacter changlensis]